MREHGSIDPVAAAEAAEALELEFWDIFDCYETQQDFITGTDRPFKLWVAGRGTGKTVAGMLDCLVNCFENPGQQLDGGIVKHSQGLMLGRTTAEIRQKMEPWWLSHLARFKEKTGIELLASYSSSHQLFTLINGAQVLKASYGRADSLAKVRGHTCAWAYLDEVMHAEVDSLKAFEIVAATLRDPLMRKSSLSMTTTPDGYRGIVAHFMKKIEARDPRFYMQTATVYDNPYNPPEFAENLKAGCSPRMWKQEGLGHVLRPLNVVYGEFDHQRHVVPWQWDRRLPWVLMVDWGTNWGWIGCAQVVDRAGYYNSAGFECPPGTWIVSDEYLMREGSYPEQRKVIGAFVEKYGAPVLAGADRAVKSENGWLRGSLHPTEVRTVFRKDHQKRSYGIGLISFMLDPPDRDCPRLVFSSQLDQSLDEGAGTIISAMSQYKFKKRRLEGTGELVTTNTPEENTPPTHACDGLRYGVQGGAWKRELHGGEYCPYVVAHQEKKATDTPERGLR